MSSLARLLTMGTLMLIMCTLTPALHVRAMNNRGSDYSLPALCHAITFTLHPNLNPPLPNNFLTTALDIPRGPFTAAAPVYPGSTPLRAYVASPFPEYRDNPYLQTASAEYAGSDSPETVRHWFLTTLSRCGWHPDGYWSSNAPVLTAGNTFRSHRNANLSLEMSFGLMLSGGTYIGYGVEQVTFPPRPRASFLHGPFVQVRIAFGRTAGTGRNVFKVIHIAVRQGRAISHLVTAINSLQLFRTAPLRCPGGLGFTGPAWLTFIRPNQSAVHAYESGPGECGGLAVNGVGWVTDTGTVWNAIRSLVGERKRA